MKEKSNNCSRFEKVLGGSVAVLMSVFLLLSIGVPKIQVDQGVEQLAPTEMIQRSNQVIEGMERSREQMKENSQATEDFDALLTVARKSNDYLKQMVAEKNMAESRYSYEVLLMAEKQSRQQS